MPKKQNAEIEKLIEDIIVDCNGEDEQLAAFEVVINDAIDKYAKAFHMDEPVYLIEVNSNKGLYAGLRAKITRQRKEFEIALLDLEIDSQEEEELHRFVEAYKYFVKRLG
jgi:hypothetical protein